MRTNWVYIGVYPYTYNKVNITKVIVLIDSMDVLCLTSYLLNQQ